MARVASNSNNNDHTMFASRSIYGRTRLVYSIQLLVVVALLLGCNTANEYVPQKLTLIDHVHCWPYDVEVYSLEELNGMDDLDGYPRIRLREKEEMVEWSRAAEIPGGIEGLVPSTCDDTARISDLFKTNEMECFVSGTYYQMKNENGSSYRHYNSIAIIDSASQTLYVFEDINKIW